MGSSSEVLQMLIPRQFNDKASEPQTIVNKPLHRAFLFPFLHDQQQIKPISAVTFTLVSSTTAVFKFLFTKI